jgi:hypothetical protein
VGAGIVGAGESADPCRTLYLRGGRESGSPPFAAFKKGLEEVLRVVDQLLYTEWAAAWLREYRCQCRYIALLDMDGVEDRQLSLAWLAWWRASIECRDASCRLDKP